MILPNGSNAGDRFKKPLQVSLLKRFRSVIMGHVDLVVLFKLQRIKERVGKNVIHADLTSVVSGNENES